MERLCKTHQCVVPFHVLGCKWFAVLVDQLERAANLGLPNALGGFGYPLALHTSLLIAEIEDKSHAGSEE